MSRDRLIFRWSSTGHLPQLIDLASLNLAIRRWRHDCETDPDPIPTESSPDPMLVAVGTRDEPDLLHIRP
jgi:hypothetical protein